VSEPETETETTEEWVIEFQSSVGGKWMRWIIHDVWHSLQDAKGYIARQQPIRRHVVAWRIVHLTTMFKITREVVE
jgi:hypothetical protein